MDTITINIKKHSITEKILSFLELLKNDGIEVIKQENKMKSSPDKEWETLFKPYRKKAFFKGDLCDTIDDWGDV